MGTTLTGTTPQDTYDSLIKVTDNGPLSGTAKYLSDGLGNDSVLALSTARVGIGTSAPTTTLHVSDAAATTATFNSTFGQLAISFANSGTTFAQIGSGVAVTPTATATDLGFGTAGSASRNIVFATGASFLERMRITSTGNVGIGTDAPNFKLDVDGSVGLSFGGALYLYYLSASNNANIGNDGTGNVIFSTGTSGVTEKLRILAEGGGITFNGDTAQANALDDYEEGTWTMGVSFDNASVGVTTLYNTGTYTKIGRQVTVNGYVVLTSKGSSTGSARITGLPFSIANTFGNYSTASLWLAQITFTNQFQGYGNIGANTIDLRETTTAGVEGALTDADFANNSAFMLNFTYSV